MVDADDFLFINLLFKLLLVWLVGTFLSVALLISFIQHEYLSLLLLIQFLQELSDFATRFLSLLSSKMFRCFWTFLSHFKVTFGRILTSPTLYVNLISAYVF